MNGELVFSGDRASVLQDEKALEVMAAQRCEWTLLNYAPKIVKGLPWWPSGQFGVGVGWVALGLTSGQGTRSHGPPQRSFLPRLRPGTAK